LMKPSNAIVFLPWLSSAPRTRAGEAEPDSEALWMDFRSLKVSLAAGWSRGANPIRLKFDKGGGAQWAVSAEALVGRGT